MIGWIGDIERETLDNDTFRTVVFTGGHVQLTVMRLAPGEDIGREAHPHLDQFIRVEQGQARLELSTGPGGTTETHDLESDWAAVIPAGVWHNVVNAGTVELKLYSLYAPPEHPPDTVHPTKADADEHERHG